jgi:hypothetical protein
MATENPPITPTTPAANAENVTLSTGGNSNPESSGYPPAAMAEFTLSKEAYARVVHVPDDVSEDLPHPPRDPLFDAAEVEKYGLMSEEAFLLEEVSLRGLLKKSLQEVGADLPHAPVGIPFPVLEMAIRLAYETRPEDLNREIKSIISSSEIYAAAPTFADLQATGSPEVGADLPHAPAESAFQRAARLASQEISKDFIDAPTVPAESTVEVGTDLPEGPQTGITSGGLVTSFHPMSEKEMQVLFDEIDSIKARAAGGASTVPAEAAVEVGTDLSHAPLDAEWVTLTDGTNVLKEDLDTFVNEVYALKAQTPVSEVVEISLSGESVVDNLRRQREEKAEVPVAVTPAAPKSP